MNNRVGYYLVGDIELGDALFRGPDGRGLPSIKAIHVQESDVRADLMYIPQYCDDDGTWYYKLMSLYVEEDDGFDGFSDDMLDGLDFFYPN